MPPLHRGGLSAVISIAAEKSLAFRRRLAPISPFFGATPTCAARGRTVFGPFRCQPPQTVLLRVDV